MNGETRFKGARKRRRTRGWMRIKRGDSKEVDRQKKVRFFWW